MSILKIAFSIIAFATAFSFVYCVLLAIFPPLIESIRNDNISKAVTCIFHIVAFCISLSAGILALEPQDSRCGYYGLYGYECVDE